MNEMEKLLEETANNIVENNIEGIYEGPAQVIPCNAAVLVKPYPVNPYRKIDTTASGLIVGVESDHTYKSNETGEIEQETQTVLCGRVLAVGPACQNIEVGDDVYYTTYNRIPIPFRKQGLEIVSETLIMCRIVRK